MIHPTQGIKQISPIQTLLPTLQKAPRRKAPQFHPLISSGTGMVLSNILPEPELLLVEETAGSGYEAKSVGADGFGGGVGADGGTEFGTE